MRQRGAVEHKLLNDIKDEGKRREQNRKCEEYIHACLRVLDDVCVPIFAFVCQIWCARLLKCLNVYDQLQDIVCCP